MSAAARDSSMLRSKTGMAMAGSQARMRVQQMLEAGEVKGFGRALALAQAAAREHRVVEVEAVHRHHHRLALRQQRLQLFGERRLASTGRAGNGNDEARPAGGTLEDGCGEFWRSRTWRCPCVLPTHFFPPCREVQAVDLPLEVAKKRAPAALTVRQALAR